MLHKLLKKELDSLKKSIGEEININYNLSYGDVITFLVNFYKKSKQKEYPIEEKLRVATTLLNNSINVGTKLDGKQRVSYFVET